MPPTKTAKFGLLKPSVGGDNNQWGDTLNQTLDQVDQLLGVTGTPIVADVAARTALFPIPVVDSVTSVKSLGYQTRYGASALGINAWLPEVLTRAGGPVTTSNSKGVIGNGIVDDTPFLASADVTAALSGGRHELDLASFNPDGIALTRVFINSNLTLTSHFRPNPGSARIYVAAGKTFAINGNFDPSFATVFDPTSPGTISFGKVRKFYIDWFGVKGDGITNDVPAINFALHSVPDYSEVLVESSMNLAIYSEVLQFARRGIKLRSTVPSFPDGNGAQVTWLGPAPIRFNDATVVNGSRTINFTNNLPRVPAVGERFIISQPGIGAVNAVVVAATANSVTLDPTIAAPTFNAAGVPYTIGGVMFALISCDHCDISGFTIRPHPINGVKQGFSGVIAAGSHVLTRTDSNIDFNNVTAGNFVRVEGAGPGGTDLFTTIQSIDNTLQATLVAAATTGISAATLANFMVGPNPTSDPAMYCILVDLTNLGATGTNSYFEDNLFSGQVLWPVYAISISITSQQNQENHRVRRNTVNLGGTLQSNLTVHVTTAAGSTTVHNDEANAITTGMLGMRIRIPKAGLLQLVGLSINNGSQTVQVSSALNPLAPWMIGQTFTILGAGVAGAALVAVLNSISFSGDGTISVAASTNVANANGSVTGWVHDTKIISITDNQHFVIKDAAPVAVASVFPNVGENKSTGVEIGASFNAKKIGLADNIFGGCLYGIRCRGGSYASRENQFEACEYAFYVDENSTACTSWNDDHESCLRYIYTNAQNSPVSFFGSRIGSISMIAQGGHVRMGPSARKLKIVASEFDTAPDPSTPATFFELSSGSNNLVVEDCDFPTGGVTMAQVIDEVFARTVSARYRFINCIHITDIKGTDYRADWNSSAKSLFNINASSSGGESHPVDIALTLQGDSVSPQSTIRSQLDSTGGSTSPEIAAIDAGIGQTHGNGFDGDIVAGVLVRMPIDTATKNSFGGGIHGVHVKSGGSVNNVQHMYGLRIGKINQSGIANPHGVWQEDDGDFNLLAGITRFDTNIIEKATTYIDIAGGSNAAPNASGGMVYRFRLAGAASILAATGTAKGNPLKIIIFNNTAGPITPTMDASYLGTGFGAIGAGKSRSRLYCYDDVRTAWEPIGPVSEDF